MMSVVGVAGADVAAMDTGMYRSQGCQEIMQDTHVVRIGGDSDSEATQDSMQQFIRIFYEDQYRQFMDPEARIALGETQYYQKHPLSTDQYRYGLYGAINLFWKITPRFLNGVEYVTSKRKNHDVAHAGANRVDAVLSYSF